VRQRQWPGQAPEATPSYRPDAWTGFTLKPGPADLTIQLPLRRLTVAGRGIDPDGKPVAKANVFRRTSWVDEYANATVRDGHFEFPIRDAEASYPLVFFNAERGLGLAATLTAKEADKPVEL